MANSRAMFLHCRASSATACCRDSARRRGHEAQVVDHQQPGGFPGAGHRAEPPPDVRRGLPRGVVDVQAGVREPVLAREIFSHSPSVT